MPSEGPQGPARLSGWKEIAQHLKVNQRTAQRWEGLPVNRAPGERGRVTADPRELDQWRQTHAVKPSPWASLRFLRAWALSATALLASVTGLSGWRYWQGSRKGPPATFHLDPGVVRVLDGKGRLVWEHWFDPNPTPIGNHYAPDALNQSVVLVDLNGDGQNELLFAYYYQRNDNSAGSKLLCFSDRGKLLW